MPLDRDEFEDFPTYEEVAESIGEYLEENPNKAYTDREILEALPDEEGYLVHEILQDWKSQSDGPIEHRIGDGGMDYYAIDPDLV